MDLNNRKESLLGIGSVLLAPLSGGASLAVLAAGAGLSVTGAVYSSTAESKIAAQINETLDSSKHLFDDFIKKMDKWNKVAELLSEIVKELRDLFSELEVRFCNMLVSIENCTYKDESSYKVECFIKCISNFYGTAAVSTHVVRNIEKITVLARRVKSVETILKVGKNAGGVAKSAKVFALDVAIGKPIGVFSSSKTVVNTGRQLITSVQKSGTFSQTTKFASLAADGSGKFVKTKGAVEVVGKTVSKETTIVTKLASQLGLICSVASATVDFFELRSALNAAKSTCDVEKELRASIQNIEKTTDQTLSQVNVYKEVMRIKMFFESLLQHGREMVFGKSKLPHEKLKSCVDKMDCIYNIMN